MYRRGLGFGSRSLGSCQSRKALGVRVSRVSRVSRRYRQVDMSRHWRPLYLQVYRWLSLQNVSIQTCSRV
jgi:hypothetical protein